MKLKNITLATAILFTLTACGSGGGGSHKPNTNAEINSVKAQVEQLEKTLEKAKISQEQANKQLSDKEKEVAQAKENLTVSEAKLKQAEKDLATAQENIRQGVEDKTALQNQLTEANEKVKLAQNEKEIREKNLQKLDKLIQGALNVDGRSDIAIGGHYTIEIDQLGDGMHKKPFVMVLTEDDIGRIIAGYSTIYKQPYSVVYGREMKVISDCLDKICNNYRIGSIHGEKTVTMPVEGRAAYQGKGFTGDLEGTFNYQVDFANKVGSGSITGLDRIGKVNLQEGRITENGIQAKALTTEGVKGEYALNFFGPNAEEVAGKAYLYKEYEHTPRVNGGTARDYGQNNENGELIRGTQIGFAGVRDQIQK